MHLSLVISRTELAELSFKLLFYTLTFSLFLYSILVNGTTKKFELSVHHHFQNLGFVLAHSMEKYCLLLLRLLFISNNYFTYLLYDSLR